MKKLPRKFYNRSTIDVAIELLGCSLISYTNGIKTGGMIVETEAYIGEDDPACHAFRGLTPRNEVMYGPPGYLYVYFTYGNHFMMNVVTQKNGYPSAVLLRGVEPKLNTEVMAERRGIDDLYNISSGPGKLTKALNVTKDQNGIDLKGSEIYLLDLSKGQYDIYASPRIGIGEYGTDRLWRFFIKDNSHVSRGTKSIREKSFPLAKAMKKNFRI